MAEWSVGATDGRVICRDGRWVAMAVDGPEIAAEIVETMNRVGALLAEVRPESGRERSPTCPNCPGPQVPHQHLAITRTEFDRIQDQLSRVDPYDSTKGGATGGD